MPTPSCIHGNRPVGFDMGMELLMTVPPGCPAKLDTLAQDFRMTRNEAQQAVKALSSYGVQLFETRQGTEYVSIKRTHRTRARETAEAYYDRVHGARLLPAWKRRELETA